MKDKGRGSRVSVEVMVSVRATFRVWARVRIRVLGSG
jgi:hypothetical protein